MLMLTYANVETKEPLISAISRKFHVDASIIFGNVEVLKHSPLGKLAIILSGDKADIEQAQEYIVACGIEVEVLKEC